MQGPPTPTEDDVASILPEHVHSSPNLNRAVPLRRKAARRTLPFELALDEIQLAEPPPPPSPDEEIQDRKRPRLNEKPFSTSTDEATTKNTACDTTVATVALPTAAPFPDVAADQRADSYPMMDDVHPNAMARAHRRWTPEEDAKLTSALTNPCKKKRGKEYKTDWVAIATLVPGRTTNQCWHRWRDSLEPRADPTPTRTGRWTTDEDTKLKDAVQLHDGKNWDAIARSYLVERDVSVAADGMLSWIPALTGRLVRPVVGHTTKTKS
jgi:hypothetical protein